MSQLESGRLIGLHGQSRAGKDSVARILREDFDAHQRVLAGPIRSILYDLDPLIEFDDGHIEQLASAVRRLGWDGLKGQAAASVNYMIRLGQSARDHVGPNVWLDASFPPLSIDPELTYCCSDIRQPNEVEYIQTMGGQMWKIIRPGTVDRGMDNLLKNVKFDQVIVNDGSLEDLRWAVHAAMKNWGQT